MSPVVIACAHCGAPLSLAAAQRAQGDLWPCMHCGSLLRIASDGGASVERQVPEATTRRIRELVLAGKDDEARALCAAEGLPVALVDETAKQVTARVLFSQGLSPVGCLFLLAYAGAIGGGIALVANDQTWGWALVVVAILLSLPLVLSFFTTVKMRLRPRAAAVIRRATLIGERPVRGQGVHIFAFAVEAAPLDGSPGFAGTVLVPVRATSLNKAVPGTRIFVRFDKNDRGWLRFDGMTS